ncbi:PREDICTED: uncharacterized protein LOC109243903 [Nicotiana attenuata]|uniref:uncharacterized protein LOC109243903 n=1 Tax=Nicotiana attenuata TaxID=49451 RepID=UPI0009058620|nr:PREDICTED: uncharacterized protein LOC109243903 [Nicotiana attenuata]
MDYRSWMYNRNYPNRQFLMEEFIEGVEEFITHAMSLEPFRIGGLIRCPCVKCKCLHYFGPEDVKTHLCQKGFKDNYFVWTSHGEIDGTDGVFHNVVGQSSRSVGNNVQHPRYHEMVADALGMHFDFETNESVEQPPIEEAKYFYEQLEAASRPLKQRSMHSQLSVTVRLLSIKSDTNISQAGMDSFIGLMSELVDPDFNIPVDFYKAKRLVSKLGLSSRLSSGKKAAVKSMHYLPLIPRLKRLYASMSSAPHMRWHYENRRPPGVMCHPSDGEAWKHFDRTYPDYASEPRNVRLGLCADGFTPFSVSATPYSYWPVFITPYNLPPEMCMTSPYIFLNCVIPGPRNPKSLIDVYLQPLIDELKQLWYDGVETYDISTKQNFNLCTNLMWTINDFPAYGILSGWMTAEKLACPYCMKNGKAFTLKHGRKQSWFDCHRQFLPIPPTLLKLFLT